jgi:hypothetical protein
MQRAAFGNLALCETWNWGFQALKPKDFLGLERRHKCLLHPGGRRSCVRPRANAKSQGPKAKSQ